MDARLKIIMDNLAEYYLEGAGKVDYAKLEVARNAVYDLFGVTEDEFMDHVHAELDRLFVDVKKDEK